MIHIRYFNMYHHTSINPLTPNDPYRGRTAPLTSKRCILYIYSRNIGTDILSVFYLHNAVCFIILTYLVPVLFTFYIQGVLKLKKNYSGAQRLIRSITYKLPTLCSSMFITYFIRTFINKMFRLLLWHSSG